MSVTVLDLGREPVTLNVEVTGVDSRPYTVAVVDRLKGDYKILYDRTVKGNSFNFNLPRHTGKAYLILSEGKVKSILKSDLKFPDLPYLDKAELSRPYDMTKMQFRPNRNMRSPARMFVNKPVIEYNPDKMREYSEPVKVFIMFHEAGHQFFDDEIKTDRFAVISFLNAGYNLSSAMYALKDVLNVSEENIERILSQHDLLKHLSRSIYG